MDDKVAVVLPLGGVRESNGGMESRKKMVDAVDVLPAKSTTTAEKECELWVRAAVGVKLAEEAEMTACVVTSTKSTVNLTEAAFTPVPVSE